MSDLFSHIIHLKSQYLTKSSSIVQYFFTIFTFFFTFSLYSSLHLVLLSVCMEAKMYEWFERLALYHIYNQDQVKACAVK